MQSKRCWIIALWAWIVWGLTVPLSHAEDAVPLEQERLGTHFIVMVDESGDMKKFNGLVDRCLPLFLFEGDRGDGLSGPLRFDPERDRISMVFFTIHFDSPGEVCGKRRAYSALGEHMFAVYPLGREEVATREAFASVLRAHMEVPCRGGGNLSPIATAPWLVVSHLGNLDRSSTTQTQFSRTLLVIVTNRLHSPGVSPAFELQTFSHVPDGPALLDVKATIEQVQELSRFFSVEYHFDLAGKFSDGAKTLFVDIAEVRPVAPPPELLVSAKETVVLDRRAVSSTTLSVVPADTDTAIRIDLPDRSAAAGVLQPYRLHWRLEGAEGGRFSVGGATFVANENVIDLCNCADLCRQQAGQLIVPVAGLVPELTLTSVDELPTGGGRISFSVAFHFDSKAINNSFIVETGVHHIELEHRAAQVVPGELFFSPVRLDNPTLAALWQRRDGDHGGGGLTQEEAVARVHQQRDSAWLSFLVGAVLVAILAVAATLLFLFLTAYHRPFRPRLEWRPASAIEVDFNRPASSRVLAGTLRVSNPEPVPWFGAKLGNTEQPTRNAVVRLEHSSLADLGLEVDATAGSALGFLETGSGCGRLSASIEVPVSDGKPIHVFLAVEAIRDVDASAAADPHGELVLPIEMSACMVWPHGRGRRRVRRQVEATCTVDLRLKPEASRPPLAAFQPAPPGGLFFSLGDEVEVGEMVFSSRAGHRFAEPHVGDYLVRACADHRPLAGDPIRLARSPVKVAAGAESRVPVRIHCDGELVPNPEPHLQHYELRLLGSLAEGSESGPHQVALLRDPRRTEMVLHVVLQQANYEVFARDDGSFGVRCDHAAAGGAGEAEVVDQSVRFARPWRVSVVDGGPAITMLSLRLASSANAGRGWVGLQIEPRVCCDGHYDGCLHLRPGYSARDLIAMRHDGRLQPLSETQELHLTVHDTDDPVERELCFVPEAIERIDGAHIPATECRVEICLRSLVCGDDGETIDREVTLVIPLELRQRPGLNIACIDFGTSAVAVGNGNAEDGSFRMVRLQDVPAMKSGKSLGAEDPGNAEAGTPFLPSWAIFDAHERSEEPASGADGRPEGFPKYRPASLLPGEPSFVGLPALESDLVHKSGRVALSLKSWLARSSDRVCLLEEGAYQKADRTVVSGTTEIPLDGAVESALAALSTAYLKQDPLFRADQLVLCHPNTFTPRHTQRLHELAYRAFGGRLGIAAPEFVHLISESDAVAYHYCTQVMNGQPRSGPERILVFDLGGGTLDLSVVTVEWQRDPFFPRAWTHEARLGVPVAGNAFDEALARIIDELLRDTGVLGDGKLVYQFPLVAHALPLDSPTRTSYCTAVFRLWRSLREAKQRWDGSAPFEVMVGQTGATQNSIVRYLDNTQKPLQQANSAGSLGAVIFHKDRDIKLSIPAHMIHGHSRIRELVDFMVDTVVDETLACAGIATSDIDTVLVSGRAAQWPGLRQRLHDRFPAAAKPDLLTETRSLKEAVARGAIARQHLLWCSHGDVADRSRTPLAVLHSSDTEIVTEDRWSAGRPIDLTNSPAFRLVQVALRHPDPRRDMGSLRRHFYQPLTERYYRRDLLWSLDPRLYVVKQEKGDHVDVILCNSEREEIRVCADPAPVTRPPWPIGHVLLEPEERVVETPQPQENVPVFEGPALVPELDETNKGGSDAINHDP